MEIRNRVRNLMRAVTCNRKDNQARDAIGKAALLKKREGEHDGARHARCATRTGAAVLAAALALSGLLTACGKAPAAGQTQAQAHDASSVAASAQGGADAPQAASENNLRAAVEAGKMTRDTQDGFYTIEDPKFVGGQNIMFFDYNTLTQRYLCSAENCKHDNAQCTSFVLGYGAIFPFVAGDKLYLNYYGYPDEQKPIEEWTAALVRCNLDGTDAEIVAQVDRFGAFDFISTQYTDGEALYTLSGWDGVSLVRVDFATGEVTRSPWDENNNLVGVWGRKFLSLRREIDGQPAHSFSAQVKLIATDADTGESTVLHTFAQHTYAEFGARVKDDKLYYVNPQTRAVMAYDLIADTESVVTDAFAQYGEPYARDVEAEGLAPEDAAQVAKESPIEYPAYSWYAKLFGDWLVANVGNDGEMQHLMAYNLQTQAVHEIAFTDFWNGSERNMSVEGLTPHGFLVVEETRNFTQTESGMDGKPYKQERSYPVYALMSEENLLSSTPNFRTIQPVQYGNESAAQGMA